MISYYLKYEPFYFKVLHIYIYIYTELAATLFLREYTDERNPILPYLKSFHKSLGAGFSDGTEVVNKISLGHPNAGILDGEGPGCRVWGDRDLQVLSGIQQGRIRERLETDLVQRIGRVGDEFPQEDVLVAVERVDDQTHELSDLGLEGEGVTFLILPVIHSRHSVRYHLE